jgi:alanine-synthesizing transaminase
MPTTKTAPPVRVAARVSRFSYAIRNIVSEARAVEARGVRVRYLNIGDPVAFGFKTPPHLIEAAERAMRDGNGVPVAGHCPAREAVATIHGVSVPDRVLITRHLEGIELALTAVVDDGEEVLVPAPTYPLYTAVLAKIGALPSYYRTDPPTSGCRISILQPDSGPGAVVIDPNNPTGAVYPPSIRRGLIDLAEAHGLTILADEVYGEVGFDGPVPLLGTLEPDAPIISFSSLSKAYLAPGWRTGWMVVGRTPRLDDVLAGARKLADGRLCSPGPMQYAVTAALTGDRSHQVTFRHALAGARVTPVAQRDRGHHVRAADGGLLRDAARGAAARQDRRGLRARPAESDRHPLRLRVRVRHASDAGHLRIVFSPNLPSWPRSTQTSPPSPGLPRPPATPCAGSTSPPSHSVPGRCRRGGRGIDASSRAGFIGYLLLTIAATGLWRVVSATMCRGTQRPLLVCGSGLGLRQSSASSAGISPGSPRSSTQYLLPVPLTGMHGRMFRGAFYD